MGILERFRSNWSLTAVERPWPKGSGIFDHLRQHIEADGRLALAGRRLPDETQQDPSKLQWAAGALDGVFGHHLPRGESAERVAQLSRATERLLERASAANFAALYALATRDTSLGVVDGVTDALRARSGIKPERVHALALVLIQEAPQREAVKLGLALIGIIDADDTELISLVGVHDEFTLFSAVALVNQNRAHAERALLALGRRVDGWGRIQIVERLSETRDPEIRAWLLREGFRNSVMDEYLAFTCATTGELHLALAASELDEPLLRGAAGILRALALGGPARDLGDYSHAAEAVAAFLGHVQRRPLDLELLSTLDALAEREELSAGLRQSIDALRLAPLARGLIDAGLASSDQQEFFRAESAANARGVDTFAVHEARVRAGELSWSLAPLLRAANAANIERALDALSAQPPLTGASTATSEAQAHLNLIVQALQRFPGKGLAFVSAALASTQLPSRIAALRALAAWSRAHWPAVLVSALDRAIQNESDDELRTRMERVREGGAFDAAEDEPQEPAKPPRLLH